MTHADKTFAAGTSRRKSHAANSKKPAPAAQLAYSIPVQIGQAGSALVEIRVSRRRKKSAQAHLEAGKVVVVVPAVLTAKEREEVAARLALRMIGPGSRKRLLTDRDLELRARQLADRFLSGVRPSSVRFVANQTRRWGSCTPATGEIRLSSRLQGFPSYVVDAVIFHELAHLLEASHSPRFKALCDRYPRQAEADAFLLGFERGVATASMPLGPIPDVGWGTDDVILHDGIGLDELSAKEDVAPRRRSGP
jgi:hypothetical protein